MTLNPIANFIHRNTEDAQHTLLPRPIALLIPGSILSTLSIDISFQEINLGGILQTIGFTLILLGGAVLLRRPYFKQKQQLKLAMVSYIPGASIKVLAIWGGEWFTGPYWNLFSSALMTIAFVLGCLLLRSFCTSKAWPEVSRAWSMALYLGAVIYGIPLLVMLAGLIISLFTDTKHDFTTHNLLWLAAVCFVAVLPSAFFIRALAMTGLKDARAMRRLPVWSLRIIARPSAIGLLVVIQMLPIWLMVPAYIHYNNTPDYDTFLAANPGSWDPPPLQEQVKVLETRRGNHFQFGELIMNRRGDKIIPGIKEAEHTMEISLKHGDEILLDLDHEFIFQGRYEKGKVTGLTLRFRRLYVDPRFHLMVRTVVDLECLPISQGGKPIMHGDWICPFQYDIALVSGPGDPEIETLFVNGLPKITGEPRMEKTLFTASGQPQLDTPDPLEISEETSDDDPDLFSKAAQNIFGFCNTEPPPPGDGLVYAWHASGLLGIRDMGMGLIDISADLENSFSCNYEEYSYKQSMNRFYSTKKTREYLQTSITSTRNLSSEAFKIWNKEVW